MEKVAKRLEYLKNELQELIKICKEEIDPREPSIPSELENRIHDLLQGSIKLFDNLAVLFFEAKIKPFLSEQEIKSIRSSGGVGFPHSTRPETLDRSLEKKGFKGIKESHPKFFAVIEGRQPYQENYAWLVTLRNHANLAHEGLIPQEKFPEHEVKLGNMVVVRTAGAGSSVSLKDCFIQGYAVGDLTVTPDGIDAKGVDPRLDVVSNLSFRVVFPGTDQDALELVSKALLEVENMLGEIVSLLKAETL